jgi:hypothetical protein
MACGAAAENTVAEEGGSGHDLAGVELANLQQRAEQVLHHRDGRSIPRRGMPELARGSRFLAG